MQYKYIKVCKKSNVDQKILVLKLKRAPRIESPTTMQTKNNYVDWTSFEPHAGIEPATYALQVRRSTNWANGANELSLKPLQESCSEIRTLLHLLPAASPQCLTGNSIPNQVLQARNIWLYVSHRLYRCQLAVGDRFLNLVALPRFERRLREPKPLVLPLHHRAIPYKNKKLSV